MFKNGLLFALTAIILVSCVPKKQLAEMETLKNNVQKLLDEKEAELRNKEKQNRELQAKIDDCREEQERLRQDSTKLQSLKAGVSAELEELQGQCNQLNENYQQLKSKSSRKMQELVDQLENSQKELLALQEDLSQRERKLREVQASLQKRDSTIRAIEAKVADALLGFKDKGLTVEMRDGKVYVSLSNKLLFASGSTKIDPSGKQALNDLASVLSKTEDISIMVEGHTDDVPVSNLGQIKDNWDLSVMRSTEVVRILVEAGVEPTRIIPAGRGEFMPKEEGSTRDARAANRRTEIIISPRLDELFELINSED